MDLSFLKTLYQNQPDGGGYVSVYLDTTPTSAGAGEELSLRWRAARERLAGAGADDATLDAVEEVLSSRTHDARGQAVFAATGTVLFDSALPLPPREEIARYAPLPHVMPLLTQLPARLPHVLVAANRAGGQVLTVSSTGAAAKGDVAGESWPVHKVSTGGWSEQRLQRSAEETWANNARRTAGAARDAARRVHAKFVVVGGDAKERTMVLDLLPPPLREAAVVVDKETAPDSPAFTEAADAEVAKRTDSASRAQLDEFRVRMNGKDRTARRAVEGLRGTLAAAHAGPRGRRARPGGGGDRSEAVLHPARRRPAPRRSRRPAACAAVGRLVAWLRRSRGLADRVLDAIADGDQRVRPRQLQDPPDFPGRACEHESAAGTAQGLPGHQDGVQ